MFFDILLYILCLIFSIFFVLYLHESTHKFFAEIYNQAITVFKPYPHFYKEEGSIKNRFYFGRVSWIITNPDIQHKIYIAPLYNSLICLGACSFVSIIFLLFANMSSCYILEMCFLVDILFWIRGYFWGSELCDGKKYKYWKKYKEELNENRN